MSIHDGNKVGGLEPVIRSSDRSPLKPADRGGNLSRADSDSAELNSQPAGQRVHCLLRQVKSFEGDIHRQDSDRLVTVRDFVTRATGGRIPASYGVHPAEVGEGGEGTEGGVPFGHETVDPVGAGHGRQ